MGIKSWIMNGFYVSKCVYCVSHNARETNTLPLLCPATDMPCFMLLPDKVKEAMIKHANMSIRAKNFGREPLDSPYMDADVVKRMQEAYSQLPPGQRPYIKY